MRFHIQSALVLAIAGSVMAAALVQWTAEQPPAGLENRPAATTRPIQNDAQMQRLRSLGYLN